MARIDLTEKETALLTEVLESSLNDARTERLRTENREYHAHCVERENFISTMLTRLEQEKVQ